MVSSSEILNASILVVDDLKVNVLLLERTLSEAGYRSITSTTRSKDVFELHRKNRYDLILLDLEMPGLDGFQVMEQLKEIETEGYLPVLVLTAQPEHKLRALKAGARDFVSKPFDLAEVLIRVRNMIEVRLLHLETKKLFDQVTAEKKISERLLLNVLPPAIAERLKGIINMNNDTLTEIIADSFKDVTVLFADIVGFTKFSEGVSANVMIHVLNDIFTLFDSIADYRGLEKIKTIGDAYMAVAGLPDPVDDHATRAAHMALDMLEVMDRFNKMGNYDLKIRIGISSGAAVAGVIGKRKFLYDLWGDVVNTASRMESHGVSGRIQITDSTRKQLDTPFLIEQRGKIIVKDMGEINTWFLNGREGQLIVHEPHEIVEMISA
jgi:adenylate cyclase